MENGVHAPTANGDLKGPASPSSPASLEQMMQLFGPGNLDAWGEDTHRAVQRSEKADAEAPAETPKAATFSALFPPGTVRGATATTAAAPVPSESALASLLLPDIGDISDSGSRRSSMPARVPSRQLLQNALDLAQKAVEMDKSNDVAGALAAYRDAVAKLRVVMERVGVDPTSDGKRGGKNEDEGRTLRGIHDAYMARITLLSAYEGTEADEATSGVGNLVLDSGANSGDEKGSPLQKGSPLGLSIETGGTDVAGPSTPLRSPAPSSTMSSRRKRKIPSKQSFGLDEEADLSGVDGAEDEDEASAKDFAAAQARNLTAVEGSPRASTAEDDRPLPPLPPSHKPGEGAGRIRKTSSVGDKSVSNSAPQPNGDAASLSSVRPLQTTLRSTLAPPARYQGSAMNSPRPGPQPAEPIHRPFHLLKTLRTSMSDSGSGAYLTSSIHIDPGVWKPNNLRSSSNFSKSGGQPKVAALEAKARVCEALVTHLEAIKTAGSVLLEGQREDRRGTEPSRLPKAQIDQAVRAGDELATLLDALDDELDSTFKALQSRGVHVGEWKGKSKTSWGSRFSARVDKMSRGSDSPDRYIESLAQFFTSAQTIDDHLRCFTGPSTPGYYAIPHKTYTQIEARVTRAAQFVGTVIVPFVMDDLRQFMLGYLKGGVRYLEE